MNTCYICNNSCGGRNFGTYALCSDCLRRAQKLERIFPDWPKGNIIAHLQQLETRLGLARGRRWG